MWGTTAEEPRDQGHARVEREGDFKWLKSLAESPRFILVAQRHLPSSGLAREANLDPNILGAYDAMRGVHPT